MRIRRKYFAGQGKFSPDLFAPPACRKTIRRGATVATLRCGTAQPVRSSLNDFSHAGIVEFEIFFQFGRCDGARRPVFSAAHVKGTL